MAVASYVCYVRVYCEVPDRQEKSQCQYLPPTSSSNTKHVAATNSVLMKTYQKINISE